MFFKNFYRKIVPAAIRKKISLRVRVYAYIRHEVKKKTSRVVASGPFRGMKMDLDDIPMGVLLGTVELEIHPAFDKLSVFRFDQIINVGATEGYYAVGMALKWPQATVYAFETLEDIYRPQILKLASDNFVANRVHIRGYCSHSDLINLLSPDKSTLLMLDVEADETKLLDPVAIDELRRAAILVELHDVLVPGCSKIIEERFQNTHNISKYITRPRTIKDFPLHMWNIVNSIMEPFVVSLMYERLVPQEYFLMIPKNCIATSEAIK